MENLNNQGNEQLDKLKTDLNLVDYPPEFDNMVLDKGYDVNMIFNRLVELNKLKPNDFIKLFQIVDQITKNDKFEFYNNCSIIKRVK